MRRAPKTLVLAFCSLLLLSATAPACPGCKNPQAVKSGSVQRSNKGFSYSVLFMLGFPVALMVGVGTYARHLLRPEA